MDQVSKLFEILDNMAKGQPPQEVNPAGWPRPKLDRRPIPWLNGPFGPEYSNWAFIDRDRRAEAAFDHKCLVCGEVVPEDQQVYALQQGKFIGEVERDDTGTYLEGGAQATTFGHPRCILLAATHCPHLQGQKYVAQTNDGRRMTKEELAEYVREHPRAKVDV